MYIITLLVVGKLKEDYWRRAEQEYLMRMKPYAKFRVRELAEIPFRDISQKESIIEREGAIIIEALPSDSVVIALDPAGSSVSTDSLAEQIRELGQRGDELVFVIGGPLGLSSQVKVRARICLSLTHLTLTHQLARIVLAEQLYRVMTIVHGKRYHY